MIPSVEPGALPYVVTLILLVFGATLRLSRLITTDTIGQWFVRDIADRWAERHEVARREAIIEIADRMKSEPMTRGAEMLMNDYLRRLNSDDPISWQARLVSGLGCPFCIGFWIGAVVLVLTVVLTPIPHLGVVWVAFIALLTLNYIVGHISARID